MTESELITEIIRLKQGDKAFLLWCEDEEYGRRPWVAAIGNKSPHVGIGEALAYGNQYVDFCAEGATPLEAIANLHALLKEASQ
ncbi:MAG: hypothetical protein PBV01_10305 [Brucella anthropi]